MMDGFDENTDRDQRYTHNSEPEPPFDDKEREDPPVKEPPREEPPLRDPEEQDPPLDIPSREEEPRELPPGKEPSKEDPPVEAGPEALSLERETRYKRVAPRVRKEVEYDRRNYTYNIDRFTDGSQSGGFSGTGEGPGEDPQGSVDYPTRYTGYEITARDEVRDYNEKTASGSGYESPGPGGREYGEPPRKRRSLLSTFLMVLMGAILGGIITLAVLNYLLPGGLESLGRGGGAINGSGQVQQASTRTLITAPLAELGDTLENRVAAKATPSVVGITTRSQSQPQFGATEVVQGIGSGIIVSEDGFIVTNSHVVDGGAAWELKIILSDETVIDGEVLWSDAALDLAILKADATGLIPVEIGSSDRVRVGDKAIAIGNPLGMNLQSTMTSGYISGLDRSIDIMNSGTMDGLIQTDAAINEGNSGGALLNAAGQLIGINTAKVTGTVSNIGFAIPVDTVTPIIEKVMEQGYFDNVYMGLSGYNLATLKAVNNSITIDVDDGVYISSIMAGTAADEAGLVRNDIITAIDGSPVKGMTDMKKILLRYELGDTIEVTYYRNNAQRTTELTFAQNSSNINQYRDQTEEEP